MKYIFGLLIGIVFGAATGAAIVYFNPMILDTAAPMPNADAPFSYRLDDSPLLGMTPDIVPGFPLASPPPTALWERGIRGAMLQSFAIDDANGAAAAVATKIVVPSGDSNALEAGLVADDYWLITLPGRGSMVANGRSNLWPMLRDSVVRVDLLSASWEGPKAYNMQRGGAASLTGASGEYTGVTGALTETTLLADYPSDGLSGLAGQLDIRLDSAE